jgi:hypothetical protein
MTPVIPQVLSFLAGMVAMGFAVAALFFLRFWRRTGDSLFMTFAAAFALLALQQVVMTGLRIADEDRSLVYLLRLAAFVLIIVAILRKNLGARGS